MATTGFSFRGSDRVLILGGVLVLLWAWNPDALKRIFPFLPPFPGTGHGGAKEDAAPAPAAPEEPSPFVPSPWWGVPTPDPDPAPHSPPPTAPAQPVPAPVRCYAPQDLCDLFRGGVHHVIPSPGGCGKVVCNFGWAYDLAAVYADGRPRPLGNVRAEGGYWEGWNP